ncbi:MAG: hypothetical protein FDZ69_00290 [Deltaproteobacteria bacterium]|nr:MAG: hypothetical protein FDZ69_00290 [Deltaproteobacteria bacterium]
MKLLVCDVEGTIFKAEYKIDGTDYASTMWQPLARSLGDAAVDEERETHRKWEDKDYSNYAEWVEATVQIHKKYGLHRDTFYSLVNSAEYNTGVLEFFAKLDRKKFIPVLVSGGFEELISRAMRDLNIYYGYGACEYFFDETDGKLAGHRLKHCDFEDKLGHIEPIFKRFELHAKKDWVFVGDGKNDVHIAKRAPISFAINAHPHLAEVPRIHQIDDFMQINDILKTTPESISIYTSKEDELQIENNLLKKENKQLREELGKSSIETSVREERLSREVHNLRKTNKELKQQVNDLKGIVGGRNARIENHVAVNEDDYSMLPAESLSEILDGGYRVAFFGFSENHSTYQYFSDYHRNLKVMSGFTDTYDANFLKTYDFIFEFIDNMSHAVDKKNKAAMQYVPFAKLEEHGSPAKLENAMANVLIRHFKAE